MNLQMCFVLSNADKLVYVNMEELLRVFKLQYPVEVFAVSNHLGLSLLFDCQPDISTLDQILVQMLLNIVLFELFLKYWLPVLFSRVTMSSSIL